MVTKPKALNAGKNIEILHCSCEGVEWMGDRMRGSWGSSREEESPPRGGDMGSRRVARPTSPHSHRLRFSEVLSLPTSSLPRAAVISSRASQLSRVAPAPVVYPSLSISSRSFLIPSDHPSGVRGHHRPPSVALRPRVPRQPKSSRMRFFPRRALTSGSDMLKGWNVMACSYMRNSSRDEAQASPILHSWTKRRARGSHMPVMYVSQIGLRGTG